MNATTATKGNDGKSFSDLHERGWMRWWKSVSFDERALCCERRHNCTGHSDRNLCSRARGTFRIASILISAVGSNFTEDYRGPNLLGRRARRQR